MALTETVIGALVDSVASGPPPVAEPPTAGVATPVRALARAISVIVSKKNLFDLRLPSDLLANLAPLFSDIGFELAPMEKPGKFGGSPRRYTLASHKNESTRVALLHLSSELVEDGDWVPLLDDTIQLIGESQGRLLAQGYDAAPALAYGIYFKSLPEKRPNWEFVPWIYVQQMIAGQLQATDVLISVTAMPNAGEPAEIPDASKTRIINILAEQAGDPGIDADLWFSDMVTRANLPQSIRNTLSGRWLGKAEPNARALVDRALKVGLIPAPHAKEGDSTLGWLLRPLLDDLGNPNRRDLARIMLTANMFTRPNDIDTLRGYVK